MNLFDMLTAAAPAAPTTTTPKKRRGKRGGNPEQYAKRKVTMRTRRNARWKEAFLKCKDVGAITSKNLSAIMGRDIVSINASLNDLRKEVPPLVRVVGSIEKHGAGRDQLIYEWIGD